jgi:cytochrome c biogenesis protein CcmG/thiol:disulfide interchange protein DsbE
MQENRAASPALSAPRRGPLLWPLAVFAIVAALFGFALRSGDPSRLPSTLIGRPAPALALPALDAAPDGPRAAAVFSTADLAKGAPAVVNFWASWCAPCVQEHPQLVALKARTGVRLYGINYKDKAENARSFLARHGNPFVAVGVDASGRAAIEWGVAGMPETFVLNGKGEIVYKHTGPISPESLESKLMPAIRAAR